jgi:transposase
MGLSPQLITKALYERAVAQLTELTETTRATIRLRAIVSAKTNGLTIVAKVLNVTTNTIRAWIKSYDKYGLLGLNYQSGRGRKSHLQKVHYEAIMEWLKQDCNLTLAMIVLKLKEEFNVESSKSAVQRVLHKLGMSYITPRQVHYKQDKSQHEAFKKKST